jgi:hypothetical protein
MPSAQEAIVVIGLGVVSVIAAALIVKWGNRNNIPLLREAAI